METKIKVGRRFEHKRLLCTTTYDGKTPQVCQVTRIAQGTVYYRPVYVYISSEGTREELGGGWHMPMEKFERESVGRWI